MSFVPVYHADKTQHTLAIPTKRMFVFGPAMHTSSISVT